MRPFKKWSFYFFCCISVLLAVKMENHLVDIAPTISRVPTSQKVVALTFDDGPLNKSTPEVLEILREKDVKATFFVVGERVVKFPALVQQEVLEGHEVGSHTYSHPWLSRINERQAREELDKTDEEISKVAPKPILLRPPGGKYSNRTIKMAQDRGYSVILWSIDTEDWRSPPVGKVVNTVLRNIKPGSIILMHDGIYPSPTLEALVYIIDSLKAQGYQFVTVTELLQYYDEKRK